MVTTGIAALLPVTALAQSNTFEDEIIVTAQKREQSLQDVPIAVSAFSGEMLQEQGIISTVDLQDITPNLRIQQNFGNGVPNYSIRGVGSLTDVSTTSSSPVAIHVNEVAHPYPVTSTNLLFDLDRIEVLRGPQGDLFGLNTTGGTINFVTSKPTDTFEASILGEYGSWDRYKLEGFVSGPIAENVRGRLAASFNKRDSGWQRNVDTGQKHGAFEKLGVRGTLAADLSDVFDVELEGHYTRDDSDAAGNRLITTATGTRFFDLTTFVPTDFITPYANYEDIGFSLDSIFFPGRTPFIDHEGYGGTLRINYDLGGMTLTSVSGYEKFDRLEFLDHDGTLLKLSDQIFESDLEGWSTELRLASNTDGPFSWIVGGNYATDKLDQLTIFEIQDEIILEFPGVGGQAPKQDRDVWAIFGHAEYAFDNGLTLIGGLRWTEEERKQTNRGTFRFGDGNDLIGLLLPSFQVGPTIFDQGDLLTDVIVGRPVPPGGSFSSSIDASDWSGKLSLNYDTDNWLLYGSVARGFKSGGFGDNAQSVSEGLAPYNEETLIAYEVGAKGKLFDNRLRLNTAIFYYDYQDQQVADSLVDPLFGNLVAQVNAPKSEVYGFEIEGLWHLSDNFTLAQNIGYSKGKFKEFLAVDEAAVNAAGPPFMPVFVDFAGENIGFPELQLNGSATYEFPISGFESGMTGKIVLDYSHESRERGTADYIGFVDPSETGPLALDAYTLVNGRISIAKEDDWELTLFGNNLFDTEYLQFRGFFDSAYVEASGQPRSWGVRFKKDWF